MTAQFSWWYADDVLRIKNSNNQELISVHQDLAAEVFQLLEHARGRGEEAVAIAVSALWLGAKARDVGRCSVIGTTAKPLWRKA